MQHSISTVTLIPMVTLYLWYKNCLDLFFEILKFIYCKLKTHLLREQYNQNEVNLRSIVFITRFKVNKIIKCSKFSLSLLPYTYIRFCVFLMTIIYSILIWVIKQVCIVIWKYNKFTILLNIYLTLLSSLDPLLLLLN